VSTQLTVIVAVIKCSRYQDGSVKTDCRSMYSGVQRAVPGPYRTPSTTYSIHRVSSINVCDLFDRLGTPTDTASTVQANGRDTAAPPPRQVKCFHMSVTTQYTSRGVLPVLLLVIIARTAPGLYRSSQCLAAWANGGN